MENGFVIDPEIFDEEELAVAIESQVKSMGNIALGRYMDLNSVVNKMDPRTKIMVLLIVMIAIFIQLDSGAIFRLRFLFWLH